MSYLYPNPLHLPYLCAKLLPIYFLLIFFLFYNNAPFVLLVSVHDILQPGLQDPSISARGAFRERDLEVSATEMN